MALTDSKTAQAEKYTGRPTVENLTVVWDGTNAVNTSVYDKSMVSKAMFLIHNDEGTANFTVQLQGGYDAAFTNAFDIGSTVAVNHGANGALGVVTDPWPYLRLKVTPSAAPAKETNLFHVVSGVRVL